MEPEAAGYVFIGEEYGMTVNNHYYEYTDTLKAKLKSMKLPEGTSYVYDHIITSDDVCFTYCYNTTSGQVTVYKLYQNVVQPEIAGQFHDSNIHILLYVVDGYAIVHYNNTLDMLNLETNTVSSGMPVGTVLSYTDNAVLV